MNLAKPLANIGPPGIAPLDGVNLMVPVVTLWLLALYSLDKALTVYIAFSQHASLADATNLIWTSSDMEIFSGTVTFWFIDRTLAAAVPRANVLVWQNPITAHSPASLNAIRSSRRCADT
ncbi:hypothetical protein F6X40_39860 [Paraburkholderia sp. UCT31]|uniref:hypothetical protein n=1 Tax=Paraburkholderia sp. UCT31 TaxID=2615209 RepID=UPI0016564C77|nr:hypothetical protein [Paraburkholderia sp. UCT31]MBC8742644.1 hypothetical protein [Paraburkholderia sp. UCT31]